MTISKLTGVLVFVQVETAKPCYVEEKGHEWKSSIVVSEDDADAWDEAFPKQTAKQVKTSEFEEIYKIPAPFPDQRKQYVVTLRKNTKLGNGNDVPAKYTPKVFQQKGSTLVDVTKSILPANGSEGQMSVDVYDSVKMGTFARLKNVLVTKMIEYTKAESGGGNPGSEFGFDVQDVVEEATVVEKEKPKVAAKQAKKVVEVDIESPF